MLLNTFQTLDEDGDSALTYDDMKWALGPKQLDVNFDPEDLNKILLASDKNRDGFISYKEFLDFLKVHDIEPNYSPFYDGRRRQVDKLREMKVAPRKYAHIYEERQKRLHDTQLTARKTQKEPDSLPYNLVR
jgi:hypothetical protein